jgi:hypothetical protein
MKFSPGILAALLLAACAGGNIRYDAPEPPAAGKLSASAEYAGVYRGQLPFRALTMTVADGHRVVILSDLGAKLIDMKIMEKTTDVYTRMPFVTYRAVADFADCFRWYFSTKDMDLGGPQSADDKPKQPDRQIHYSNVLWIKPL